MPTTQGIYRIQGRRRDERRRDDAQRPPPHICRLEHLALVDDLQVGTKDQLVHVPVVWWFKLNCSRQLT